MVLKAQRQIYKTIFCITLVSISLNGCFNKNIGDQILGIERQTEQAPKEPKEAFYTKEARYHKNLADKLSAQGDYNEALKLYQKAIKTDPHFTPALKAIAKMYEKQGNIDLTEKYLKETLTINNNDPIIHYKLGNISTLKDNYNEAIKHYDKATTLLPDFFEAYRNKGLAYKLNKQPDKALEAYEKAHQLNPDDKKCMLNLGNIYSEKCPSDKGFIGFFKKGFCEKGENIYLKAIKTDKNYADAYVNLAYLYLDQGKNEQAKDIIFKAKSIAPNDNRIITLLEEFKTGVTR